MTPAARALQKATAAEAVNTRMVHATQAPKVYDAAGDGALPGRPDMPDAPPNTPRRSRRRRRGAARRCGGGPSRRRRSRASQTGAGRRRRPTAAAAGGIGGGGAPIDSCRTPRRAPASGGRPRRPGAAGALRVSGAALLDDGAATRLSPATLAEAAVRLAFAAAANRAPAATTSLEEYVPTRRRRCAGCGILGPLLLLAPPDEQLAGGERFVGAAAALGRGTGSFDRFRSVDRS